MQAGMGAWAYHSWQRHLPSVALLPVELPGRNTRMREPCYTDLCALAKDAVSALEPEIGSRRVHCSCWRRLRSWTLTMHLHTAQSCLQ
jgi:surfactin synthase thioesterase subunit